MTADSNSTSPLPEDDVPPPEPSVFDDESIDLGEADAVEEGASALSFSGRAGPRSGGASSGGSSSGVRSWEQLVRETGSESDADIIHYGTPLPPDEAESESDKDLLREVLSGERPPSDIILKDPSLTDLNLPSAEEPTSLPFVLPTDLPGARSGDSSILGQSFVAGPGQSGFTSDVWGPPSSGVDLLRPGPSANQSGDSLQPTDEMDDAPVVAPSAGESGQALLGEMPSGVGHDESSAVDLGSHGMIDLPFPLGTDSMIESARTGPSGKSKPPTAGADPESGTVDLLASGDEFDLGLSDVTTSPSWVAAREDLPPTVPMVPAGKARLLPWAGGGVAGLLVGVAACAGLWFAGLLPTQGGKSTAPPPAVQPSPELNELRAQAKAANLARDEEAKKTAVATEEAQRMRGQLAQATAQLTQAKTAVGQAKAARDRADALAATVKKTETALSEMKTRAETLATDKATADAKLRDIDASLTALRDRLVRAETDAKAAKEQVEGAEAARKQAATVVADIARRLDRSPTAAPADLLAALDRAMAQPTVVASTTTGASASIPRSPEQARQAVWAGVNAYRAGNFAAAEHEFAGLAASPDANAIHLYYLGLTQWHLGKTSEAQASFHRGWALERASRPPPGEVEAAFERFSRADREAVNQFRR